MNGWGWILLGYCIANTFAVAYNAMVNKTHTTTWFDFFLWLGLFLLIIGAIT